MKCYVLYKKFICFILTNSGCLDREISSEFHQRRSVTPDISESNEIVTCENAIFTVNIINHQKEENIKIIQSH